jgi:hypothetical protein
MPKIALQIRSNLFDLHTLFPSIKQENHPLRTLNTASTDGRGRSLNDGALGPINATPRGLQLSQQDNLADMIRIVHHDTAE